MTAVVALAMAAFVVIGGLSGALVWALREVRGEGRLAAAAALGALEDRGMAANAERERDAARAASARLGAELNAASAEVQGLRDLLAAAREVIADERSRAVLDAPDDERGAAIDELLRRRQAEIAARPTAAPDRRDAAGDAVPGPGPAADGPWPAWADLGGDRGPLPGGA